MSSDPLLDRTVADALKQLEADEEIVVCTAAPNRVVERLSSAILGVTPNTGLTASELYGLRLLILQATSSSAFFDWEMPTLTGFSAEEFRAIADKLPRE
jgi:hypothetical protein